MLNKWRFVRYEDDGVSEYECLRCKETWSCRGGFGPFCTFCGTKWDGELVWDTEDRQKLRGIRAQAMYRKAPERAYWQIQVRCLWDKDGNGIWTPWVHEDTDGWHDDNMSYGYPVSDTSAKFMAQILAEKRRFSSDDKTMRSEYRVVMRPLKESA